MRHSFTNRLINETSPYLMQHAHNPVDWFAWGDEALQKAKTENKVILVSIGYSACHWCHVMEKESFEKEEVAVLMNENFVNIKIDREERPDLDHIYMDAVQAITGSGGWPLNVFLTPDGRPFYGGTYYPPVKAFNRSSWTEVLQAVVQSWKEKRQEIEAQAENLTAHLNQANSFLKENIDAVIVEEGSLFTSEQCDSMYTAIMKSADKVWGGFGNAPKFPQTFTIQYLLQYQHFTKNKAALQQAILSLDKMLQGGIYDHVGGGMARYSTDAEWLAPHFEKMLYDNALLLEVLCDAWQITGAKRYKHAIGKTITFIQNELLHPDGGFYAALDADSEGEEGKYYVWQKKEVETVLEKEGPVFCEFFDVREEGNWEGKNILRILTPIEAFAASKQVGEDALNEVLQGNLQKLAAERAKRTRPALDDKIILGWNALMLKAIAKAAIVLQDESYKLIAEKNFNVIEKIFKKDAGSPEMLHTYKKGTAKYPAFLDDYAYLINACITLYELRFDVNYLENAKEYTLYLIDKFSDEEGVFFFFTPHGQEDIVIRKIEIYDGATPSGNSVMAGNLAKLSIIFNMPEWKQRADRMLLCIKDNVIKYPSSFGIWASLLQQNFYNINEITVTGPRFNDVSQNILKNYLPYKIIMASPAANGNYPMLSMKSVTTETVIYLCKNYKCLPPVETIEGLMSYINE